jgi:hypothetical protein
MTNQLRSVAISPMNHAYGNVLGFCMTSASSADALYFISNPIIPRVVQLSRLQAEREYLNFIDNFETLKIHSRFGVTLKYLKKCAETRIGVTQRLSLVILSGHVYFDTFVLEDDDGKMDINNEKELEALLVGLNAKCYVFVACESQHLGDRISEKVKDAAIIAFSTLGEDAALCAFTDGILESFPDVTADVTAHNYRQMFDSGIVSMRRKGFEVGDPQVWLHPKGHPHTYHYHETCDHCKPPVHGIPVFRESHGSSWDIPEIDPSLS